MSNTFINVHSFDRQWDNKIINPNNLNDNNKKELFEWLISSLKELNISNNSFIGINLIIGKDGNKGNYDSINNISATDILVEICILLKKINNESITNDILKLLAEQMSDMVELGQCPQGRTSRLMGIYRSLEFAYKNL